MTSSRKRSFWESSEEEESDKGERKHDKYCLCRECCSSAWSRSAKRRRWDGDSKEKPILIGEVIAKKDNRRTFTISDDEPEDRRKKGSKETEKIATKEPRKANRTSLLSVLHLSDDSDPEDGGVPDLSFSQESASTELLETPPSSQSAEKSPKESSWSLGLKGTSLSEPAFADLPDFLVRPVSLSTVIETRIRKRNEDAEKRKLKKRLFFESYRQRYHRFLREKVNRYLRELPVSRSDDECWLYPSSRLYNSSSHTIHLRIRFFARGGSHIVRLNIGHILLLLEGKLTEEQKEGIIEHQWHASHLCGNWTCLNHRHIVPESGSTNLNRNRCFPKLEEPCLHEPQCLKRLKVDPMTLHPTSAPTDTNVVDPQSSQEIGTSFGYE